MTMTPPSSKWVSAHCARLRRLAPTSAISATWRAFSAAFSVGKRSQMRSRRVVDLNAFLLAYDAQGRSYEGSTPKWSGWKRLAVADAERRLRVSGVTEQRHDAGFDAVEAICVLEFLLNA